MRGRGPQHWVRLRRLLRRPAVAAAANALVAAVAACVAPGAASLDARATGLVRQHVRR